MRRDRQFAAIVSRWETNLSAFNDDYGCAAAPVRRRSSRIEARLFGSPEATAAPARGLWASVAFWRSLALVSLVDGRRDLTIALPALSRRRKTAGAAGGSN